MPYDSRNGATTPRTTKAFGTAELGEVCLAHLVADPEQLARFMAAAGYDPASVRSAVGSTELAAGLIDYVAANEPQMLAVCAASGLRPGDFMRIWHMQNEVE